MGATFSFNSRPLWGRTNKVIATEVDDLASTHAPVWGRTHQGRYYRGGERFNSRPVWGERF